MKCKFFIIGLNVLVIGGLFRFNGENEFIILNILLLFIDCLNVIVKCILI